jgi:putative FmdB family regulatory protein
MPLYGYQCAECGPFQVSRSLAEFAADAECPTCRHASPRILAAPGLMTMPANTRTAVARNEKSAWSPRVVQRDTGQSKHVHGPGCGHGHSGIAQAHGGKPWMVGHSH